MAIESVAKVRLRFILLIERNKSLSVIKNPQETVKERSITIMNDQEK